MVERRSRIWNVRGLVPALLVAGTVLSACSDEEKCSEGGNPPSGVMPDFALTDVNHNSPTHNQVVSPRHFLGRISAYYFTETT